MNTPGISRTWRKELDAWQWKIRCQGRSSTSTFFFSGDYDQAVDAWARETRKLRIKEIETDRQQLDRLYGAND